MSEKTNQEKAAALRDKLRSEIMQERARHPATSTSTSPIDSNPFVYDSPLWTDRQVALVLLGVVLVPLRLALGSVIFLVSFLLMKLSISFDFDESKPIAGWRRAVQYPIGLLTRALMFVYGFYWVETRGTPCSTREARVVVCAPHSTLFDSMYVMYSYNCPSSISKAENATYPLASTAIKALEVITVDRASKNDKSQAFAALQKRAEQQESSRHLMVFPEGTCTNRKALITFKQGAFAPGQPVQPVALQWPWTGFNLSWTAAGPSRFKLALLALCQPYLKLTVTFLPVYVPNDEEKQDAELFARNVRAQIAKVLDIPVTSHSYEDMFLAKEAKRLAVPLNETFELEELSRLYEISLSDAKSLLNRYASVYKDKQLIDGAGLAKILGIPYSRPVQELFELLRVDNNGHGDGIDFRSLLVGITQISRALNTSNMDESLELVWNVISHGEPQISEQQLYERLSHVFSEYSRKDTKDMLRKAKLNKGEIDFETFKAFIKDRPELLLVSIETIAARPSGGRRLSVLDKDGKRL